MSIIISDLSYHYSNQHLLFNHLSFSIEKQEKVSIVGDNGVGKSTLLKLMANLIEPSAGNITSSSKPYYIPQNIGLTNQSVAEALNVDNKLVALDAIMRGSISHSDFEILDDDWEIETRCQTALSYWQLSNVTIHTRMSELSGGEKTRVLLAGLLIHTPDIILLDEPSNHLDRTGRKLLYQFLEQSKSTFVVVSHDITLLNQLPLTYELSETRMKRYGGNFFFYRKQKEIEDNALEEDINEEEKALRIARKKAQEIKQRQERRLEKGQKNKAEVPRILKKTLTNSSENTASKLKEQHEEIISHSKSKLTELRQQRKALKNLKIDFDNASLHSGKLLFEARQLNFGYEISKILWKKPMNFKLFSNDRVRISGNNGIGKTTFIKILTGSLPPTSGQVTRANFSWIYLDQEYSPVDVDCSIEKLAESYNHNNLQEHEIKIRLNRFLFPSSMWDRNCHQLSGGEKMRLYLCCLMISSQTPDLIILDEPTNNLDISNLEVLTRTIKDYKGSLMVISHDDYFISEIGITIDLLLE